jgi:hypothetical protein
MEIGEGALSGEVSQVSAVFTNVSFSGDTLWSRPVIKACERYASIMSATGASGTSVSKTLAVSLEILDMGAPLTPGKTDESYKLICATAERCAIRTFPR